MATRLPGDAAHHFRTTDHTDEIALLNRRADATEDRQQRLVIRLCAELLQAHDETGISLDDWPTARQVVEHHLGQPVLPNCV